MSRKICVVTGSRSDYGLLRWLIKGIIDQPTLKMQLVVIGTHLSPEFGLTIKEIEKDNFVIDYKVETVNTIRNTIDVAESIGKALTGCAEAFEYLKPDLVLVLGDRFEIFAAATAAHVSKIPLAHLHGGEITVGAMDEAFRHSITKMAQIHFVSSNQSQKRVIQLGETPDRVFNVGGLGVDALNKITLLDKNDLQDLLKIKFGVKNLLITYHPETLGYELVEDQMKELLNAVSGLEDTTLIFTFPNAEFGSEMIIDMIKDFVRLRKGSHFFPSLGQVGYLSCIANVDGVIGNSSSGILEVPSFQKGTINIGDRQLGRQQAKSIINCKPKQNEISEALEVLYSEKFQTVLKQTVSPYGKGGASEKIINIICDMQFPITSKKFFNDL
jgi:GDP/UDP-N,N'-diacetylbacillosamine 2-epimerase (hydrolysing)